MQREIRHASLPDAVDFSALEDAFAMRRLASVASAPQSAQDLAPNGGSRLRVAAKYDRIRRWPGAIRRPQ